MNLFDIFVSCAFNLYNVPPRSSNGVAADRELSGARLARKSGLGGVNMINKLTQCVVLTGAATDYPCVHLDAECSARRNTTRARRSTSSWDLHREEPTPRHASWLDGFRNTSRAIRPWSSRTCRAAPVSRPRTSYLNRPSLMARHFSFNPFQVMAQLTGT